MMEIVAGARTSIAAFSTNTKYSIYRIRTCEIYCITFRTIKFRIFHFHLHYVLSIRAIYSVKLVQAEKFRYSKRPALCCCQKSFFFGVVLVARVRHCGTRRKLLTWKIFGVGIV